MIRLNPIKYSSWNENPASLLEYPNLRGVIFHTYSSDTPSHHYESFGMKGRQAEQSFQKLSSVSVLTVQN